ncbi:ubiquitin-related domain-containing protein [Aspergillus egyptiacus]|nr:ubiquitin-related domain-containing protein [Aspergillus egyptiacus]
MASNDHAQTDGAGPTADTSDSIPAVPNSSQPIASSTLGVDASTINTPPAGTASQNSNASAADKGGNVAPGSSQQSNTEAISSATVPAETEGRQASPSAPELPSDAPNKEPENVGPSLTIVLLLITGTRYPFKIDGDYLRKRDVSVDSYDPFSMSVYTLKELIWRDWQEDWEPRPSSPSSIRLISFGKLLDDKSPLSDAKFSSDAPNVVHMTVKPQEIVDEEDAKGSKTQYSRDREASERSPRCRCVIQ